MKRPTPRALALGALGTFAALQLVPYGRAHSNPPVVAEPQWSSPEVRVLAKRACFDCHSNETTWPWYAQVAPISWAVQHHVEDGRRHLNFSQWDRPQRHAADSAEELEEGGMPLGPYVLLHPEARLSDAEKKALLDGFRATPGLAEPHPAR